MVAVLDSLGIERADVHGTSMGGRVAQWIAARHPGRVRRLVPGAHHPAGPTPSNATRRYADPSPRPIPKPYGRP
ncbi:alpha/beta fold hydrolase [Streptomyces sp. GESEQ-13]|uniref:alpha/beta fold hydrolase n=1 Tax=Streptomyces sp. GESEQ-13 TaxID=2812654 RepID=UPI003FD5CF32